MLLFGYRSLIQRGIRSLLLLFGVLATSGAFGLLLSAAETVHVTVDEELAQYWRTTYDILVRPPGSRSDIERDYDLVQANHLSGIGGGITFDQYEAIRSIPGVEVAAPIAMLSWLGLVVITSGREGQLPLLTQPGFYRVDTALNVNDGLKEHRITLHEYHYLPSESFPLSLAEAIELSAHRLYVIRADHNGFAVYFKYRLPLLLAAIDPDQEDALVGLSRSIVHGSYFSSRTVPRTFSGSPEKGENIHSLYIPVLVNIHSYTQVGVEVSVYRLPLRPDNATFQSILEEGGALFLDTVSPSEVVGHFNANLSGEEIFHEVGRGQILILQPWTESYPGGTIVPAADMVLSALPRYEVMEASWAAQSPVLKVQPQGWVSAPEGAELSPPEIRFRNLVTRKLAGVQEREWVQIVGEIVGSIDIGALPGAEGPVYVPLETYYPPLVTLQYDEESRPVDPAIVIHPTLNPEGYIQHPPLLLTTLEAAKLFNPIDPISAIRIRVGGIDRYSPEAQARIEAIAGEIVARTGLEVDVVVGSSPQRVLVYIPGLGYVEEQWIQKGVNLKITREVKRANLVLFGVMLVSCGLYILNTTLVSAMGRRREVALQKALGWRSLTVFYNLMSEAATVGLAAGVIGLSLAIGIAAITGWQLPLANAVLILPLGLGLCLIGAVIPAIWAAHTPPVVILQRNGISGGALTVSLPYLGIHVLHGLWRRRTQVSLALLTMVTSAGLLTLFGAATLGMRGYLSGTLLGEYLLLRIEGYHYGMVMVVFIVAAFAMTDVMILETLERRREIGVLKALGWRTGAVARLFLLEGAVLGLLGGLAGTALGLAVYLGLYRSVGVGLVWAVLAGLGVPTLVGVLAAVYPARVAAAVAPAEAVRGE